MYLAQAAIGSLEEIFKTSIRDVSVTAIMDTTFELTSAYVKNADSNILKQCLLEGKIVVFVNTYIVKKKTDNSC
jgi:hypothetical protein